MWFLETSVREAIQRAQEAGIIPTAEQESAHAEARSGDVSARNGDASRLMTLKGETAEIDVIGVLTEKPSFMAMLFGGGNTTYSEIISAVASAEQDNRVTGMTLRVDSPGGTVDGLFDAIAALQSATKPIKALVINQASSAAYGLVAQADEIVAKNAASRVGSVGVAATFRTSGSEVTVSSTNAPKKIPDLTTQAGVDIIREQLDDMHVLFVDAIAQGRNVTAETVNAEFGQGGILLANEALKRGMIDSVAGAPLKVVKEPTVAESGINMEASEMDDKEVQALIAAARESSAETATALERDRVNAHLTMGAQSGDMKTALAAIADGSMMTQTLQATYMAAGMNRQDVEARADDDTDADAGDNANSSDEENDKAVGDNILSMAMKTLNVEQEEVA